MAAQLWIPIFSKPRHIANLTLFGDIMINLAFADHRHPKCVLFLGAHCDDIEIGCGGAILALVKQFPSAKFVCVTLSSDAERAAETRAAASRLLEGAEDPVIILESFKGGYFPYVGIDIKNFFEDLKQTHQPDLIFTHRRHDLHQDHRITNELTWNTFAII